MPFGGVIYLGEQSAGGEGEGSGAQVGVLQAAGGGREVQAVVAWAGRLGVHSFHLHAHAPPADGQEVAWAVTEAWVVGSLFGRQGLLRGGRCEMGCEGEMVTEWLGGGRRL